MEIRIKHNKNIHTISAKANHSFANIRTVKYGDRLYIIDVEGRNTSKIFQPTLDRLQSFAKELNCKLITADVVKEKPIRAIAKKAGFRISPRALLFMTHAPAWYKSNIVGKGNTIPMHKRVK